MTEKKDELINTHEAAEILGVKPNAIRQRIYRKTLQAQKRKGSRELWVSKNKIEEIKEEKERRCQ